MSYFWGQLNNIKWADNSWLLLLFILKWYLELAIINLPEADSHGIFRSTRKDFLWKTTCICGHCLHFQIFLTSGYSFIVSPCVFPPQSRKHASKVRLYYMLHPRDGGCPAKRLRAENVSIWYHSVAWVICYEFCLCLSWSCSQMSNKSQRVETILLVQGHVPDGENSCLLAGLFFATGTC